jgi:hypothetical protein
MVGPPKDAVKEARAALARLDADGRMRAALGALTRKRIAHHARIVNPVMSANSAGFIVTNVARCMST